MAKIRISNVQALHSRPTRSRRQERACNTRTTVFCDPCAVAYPGGGGGGGAAPPAPVGAGGWPAIHSCFSL
eukprot:COSAG01_NODE_5301_length_4351_cov_2.957432_6_plen_71_part_00